ncbi:cytochrome P450 [Saccharopolyspora erythraea]|uniref:cytochrome P450 family protein n=1 Tax=Saccharopolyspora erythraea TaxID=1836 RepID=UPI001BA51DA5|nr:cytochrome P450 [Saccharopolyspora erythraea]QUH00377.1 cytochrome P450 [Saccharopolyspora erythraea]
MRPVEIDDEFVTCPHAAYARLRGQGPVHRAVAPDGSHVWLVTRYDDVRAALADPRLSLDKAHATGGYRGLPLPPALDANLLNMDAPEHTRLRRIVARAFTAHRTELLRPRVQEIADELLDAVAGREQAELMSAFAGPLPITVICELLGVDARDRPDFRAWTDETLAPSTPDRARDSLRSLYAFLVDLIARKRAEPGADMLSTLVGLRDDAGSLTEDELTSTAFLVLFAGYENTVNLIGNGLAALLARPAQLAAVRSDRELLSSTVEELLRFDPPPQLAIRRFPKEDLEIGGVRIPAGDTVLLSLVSAHHDPARFPSPGELLPDRADNAHLAFGHGPHFCIGAPLARMEAEIAFSTVLARFPGLSLAVDPAELRWRPSFRNRGLRELPVRLS